MSGYPVHRPQPQPIPQPGINTWLIRMLVLSISGAVLLVLALGAFLTAFEMRYTERIVPGIAAYGVDLGGMTRAEAEQALASHFTYDKEAIFTFRYGDRFWQMTAGDLGVSFDVQATVEEAFAYGHEGSVLEDVVQQASAWFNGRSIAPVVQYDQQIAADKLAEIAQEINQAAVNASLTVSGTTVSTTPGVTGRRLDIVATLNQLDTIILQLNTGAEIPLVVNEWPSLVWGEEEAAAQIRTALSGPVTLIAQDQAGNQLGPWTATVDQIAAVLAINLADQGDGTLRYTVDINADAFQAYLEMLAPGLIMLPRDARFHFNEDTRQIEVIQHSANGRELDVTETLNQMKAGILRTTDRVVPMVFAYTLPQYHDNSSAAELGITQLVAETTTYYTGSTLNRRTNIAVAAAKFDGILIGPGEEFSFNHLLGDISLENEFVEGKIIYGGQTVTGVGGGVCQVSTTAFRAALLAGFPIIERNSHGYRVGYYEINSQPGLDAAIFQPTADFRFVNDTPYHLLIETSIYPANDSIQFRFYSTNPGRQVVMEGPVIRNITSPLPTRYQANPELRGDQQQQIDWAKEGADVYFTRRILNASGEQISEETIYTHYQAWASIIEVAPDSALLQNG
ncbi:MAG: VanW family protein [Anaerolineaceae bacterium]|nr:VanW family protein [Anaerolineaceae bacterium]